jgi:hypothetical protein
MPESLSPSIQHFSSGAREQWSGGVVYISASLDWKVASMFCLYVRRE